ncbi:MAG: glycosyltransferase N-terminal domain-containing protein [Planctomycetota bacterium]|nr:glycosyltransferase N-terminal domain-containing protein [Planctomycetota bacterium]
MLSLALDAAYAIAAAATAPWWMRKARGGWAERFGRLDALPAPSGPRLLIHAVSVGEVNLTAPLVRLLAPHADIVLSVTTDTGIARARALFGPTGPEAGLARVVRYPLDASWSVRRFLDAVRPSAVALVELELWPNFTGACHRRGIPVAIINGRLSARSFKRYRLIRPVLARAFGRLAFAAVQDADYAARFTHMGVAPERCHVAGTMKWDSASLETEIPGADELARELGIDRAAPLIVAGSTAPDEHELLERATPPGVQLLCAPRKPEWFDGAAAALPSCVRRTRGGAPDPRRPRFLLDTIGELRKAYALADVVVVGRSFGSLYGSDPMEPAALGKPVVIGPSVSDFRATVDAMLARGAIVQTDRAGLAGVLGGLIGDPGERRALGERARECVRSHQGAARRHADLLMNLLRPPPGMKP